MMGKEVQEGRVETERLRMGAASDGEMERMIAGEEDEGLKAAYREMLEGGRAHPGERLWHVAWVIWDSAGRVVGDIGFKGISEEGVAEIGYGIESGERGKGYATEAVRGMTAWAFGHPFIRAVEAETAADNAASRRVLEKCGFTATGETGEEGPRFVLRRRGWERCKRGGEGVEWRG